MPKLHFLNVKQGDCSIIEHASGRASVIDVSNASPISTEEEKSLASRAALERGVSGNFQQKLYPVNPISYLRDRRVYSIFRYIQTHPDMDHMDGIEALFDEFSPQNLWDTDNQKEMPASSWAGSPYRESDWTFYKDLRDSKPEQGPKRLALLSGAHGQYFNAGEGGEGGGDGLHVLAPTQALVDMANEVDNDYNRSSYVILYRSAGGCKIVFGGDSHDESWEHILENHKDAVTDVDLLIAPHHGRRSGRSHEFLDTLNPKLTFFGIAKSDHLAYDEWYRRDLPVITNNQAN